VNYPFKSDSSHINHVYNSHFKFIWWLSLLSLAAGYVQASK